MYNKEDRRYETCELTLASHAYRGYSVGSEGTNHQFPGHDVMFDVGGAPLSSTPIGNVFVTHGHDDHVGGIGTHFLRRHGRGLGPARYFVQEGDEELVCGLVRAQSALNRSRSLGDIDITAVNENSRIPLGNLEVRPFKATHRIPCLGYALWGTRTRLRAEFRGAPQADLVAAKRKGEVINETFEVPEIAFPGDTNLHIVNTKASHVFCNARLLLLECTFIDDEVDVASARRTGHVHIDDFIAAARDGVFQNEIILLTHFSARYRADYIRKTLTRKLSHEPIWERVRLLLPEG